MKRIKKIIGMMLLLGIVMGMSLLSEAAAPKLSDSLVSLKVGDTYQLTIKNAGNKTVKWSSDRKSVASVTSTGKVKAKKAGSANIVAEIKGKKMTCVIMVLANAPRLSTSAANLAVGRTLQLEVENYNGNIIWKSSKKSVATVTSKGKVKAKKKGTAKITAAINGKKLTCKISVEEEPDSAVAQASLSKYVRNSGAIVETNSNWLLFWKPRIRISNNSNGSINVWKDYNKDPRDFVTLRKGESYEMNLNAKQKYYVLVCANPWTGGSGSATISAVRQIKSIS